jgi:hypothetical protein
VTSWLAQVAPLPEFLDVHGASGAPQAWLTAGRLASLLLIAVAIAGMTAAVLSLLHRDAERQGPVVRALARQFGLNPEERRVVLRVAARAHVHAPAALLVSRGCFDAAIARAGVAGPDADCMRRVRRRLFD